MLSRQRDEPFSTVLCVELTGDFMRWSQLILCLFFFSVMQCLFSFLYHDFVTAPGREQKLQNFSSINSLFFCNHIILLVLHNRKHFTWHQPVSYMNARIHLCPRLYLLCFLFSRSFWCCALQWRKRDAFFWWDCTVNGSPCF